MKGGIACTDRSVLAHSEHDAMNEDGHDCVRRHDCILVVSAWFLKLARAGCAPT